MKKLAAHEAALLTLPVLLLVGGAWWMGRGGKTPSLHLSNPFNPGPLRLEVSPFREVAISPSDASRGADWGAATSVWEAGRWDVPKGWRDDGLMNQGDTRDLRIVYRLNGLWHTVAQSGRFLSVAIGNDSTIRADLKVVPSKASEVRLRGRWSYVHLWHGATPRGWKPPVPLETAGLNHTLRVESAPFDVKIKRENEPMPAPVVSRAPAIQVVDAKWIVDTSKISGDFLHHIIVLQLRRVDGASWGDPARLASQNLHLLDAKGRELQLFAGTGKKWKLDFWTNHSISFNPNSPSNDLFAVLATGQNQPQGGWGSIQAPLRLRGEIGDGESWPQKIDVPINRSEMKSEDFGSVK